jgi:cardiolipin synthase
MKPAKQPKPTFRSGNIVTTYNNGASTYTAMLKDIGNATASVYIANFWSESGDAFAQLSKALQAAARRKVSVYVLADHYGSRHVEDRHVVQLQKAGVIWVWFRPFNRRRFWEYNRRLHKKLLLIDDKIGYTGGVGIADLWVQATHGYPRPWRDTHFRITGPVVGDMVKCFQRTWQRWSEASLPQPTAMIQRKPGFNSVSIAAVDSLPAQPINPAGQLYIELIVRARRSLTLTTAYFGPIRQLRQALAEAAERGVNVRILTNGPHSTHSYAVEAGRRWYGQLLQAGVVIYEYQPTKIHAKLVTIDHRITTIGSANLNFRSFRHDEEFNLVVNSVDLSKQIEQSFETDLKQAQRITLEDWQRRGRLAATRQYLASFGRYFF